MGQFFVYKILQEEERKKKMDGTVLIIGFS